MTKQYRRGVTSARRAVRASTSRDSASTAAYRYVVVAPLTPLKTGEEFSSDAWPPHATLVPPFSTTAPPTQLSSLIRAALHGLAPVQTHALERKSFGRRHDVPVTTWRRPISFDGCMRLSSTWLGNSR
jgi:hypothetical protein